MANKDQVKGFEPKGPCLRSRPYTAAGAVYPGDLVKLTDAGKVAQAAASDACVGVALTYASGDGVTVQVADHPDQEFVGQSDDGTIDALTDMNLNYNFVVAAANTTFKRSGMEVDGSTGATNSNYPLKVLRLDPAIDNALGTNCKVILKINNHQLAAGTGTLGV